MSDLTVIFIGACLVNNLILDYLLGIGPALAVARKIDVAIGMSISMMLVLTITALISYPVKHYLLIPMELEYLQLVILVAITTLVILSAEQCLRRISPGLHEQVSLFIPLTILNTAVLGIALLNIQQTHGLTGSLFFGLGSGTGFGLVLVMLAALEDQLSSADIPRPFQGLSILLITLGIISMAFMGFTGLVRI